MATSITTPRKYKVPTPKKAVANSDEPLPEPSSVSTPEAVMQNQTTETTCQCDLLGAIPKPAPPGFKWQPKWELVPEEQDINISSCIK